MFARRAGTKALARSPRRIFSTTATPAAADGPQNTSVKLIGRYTTLPRDMFRIMTKPTISLRDQAFQESKGRTSFDLILYGGLVKPTHGEFFQGPNGASFHPNTFNFQNTVRLFKTREFNVARIPEGTVLPQELVLLHEHTDHFSIQCTKPMELFTLNDHVTRLIKDKAQVYTKEEFLATFPYNSAAAI